MDRNKCFYLIRKGTNIRSTYDLNHVLIVTEEVADQMLATDYKLHEKISVAEYEERFGFERTDSFMDIPEAVVPTIFTVAESLDHIRVRQVGVNTHVFNKETQVDIAVISGIHENLWPQRNYPAGQIDFTNKVRNGRIYFTVVITELKAG